jgi:hypothetical protein
MLWRHRRFWLLDFALCSLSTCHDRGELQITIRAGIAIAQRKNV